MWLDNVLLVERAIPLKLSPCWVEVSATFTMLNRLSTVCYCTVRLPQIHSFMVIPSNLLLDGHQKTVYYSSCDMQVRKTIMRLRMYV